MRRITLTIVLVACLAPPAEAHVPENCQTGRLKFAAGLAELRMAHEALDSSNSEVDPLMRVIEAYRIAVQAGVALIRCIEGD
ncbi:MAG: hypothetical protein OXO52_12590 [Rhodospirillales bacterium]|nr:hypothetical protein [Rhodospirillales bacterium]MDE0380871.1 hypothetical protein [Rhodospirillales bacterium]